MTVPFPPVLVRALEGLRESDREYLSDMIETEGISSEDLSLMFSALGHPVGATTIRTWRRARRKIEAMRSTNEG